MTGNIFILSTLSIVKILLKCLQKLYIQTEVITFAIVIAGKSHDIDFLYFNIHLQPSVKFQLSLGVEPFTTDLFQLILI